MSMKYTVLMLGVALSLSALGQQPPSSTLGPNPQLAAPDKNLIPTINIAPAIGWAGGGKPAASQGLKVVAFAAGLAHPRWLYVLPNGDVLVAETNAPERPEQGKGIKGWFKKRAMKKAGAATPSANRITLLRDVDGDGVAETRSTFLEGLNSPFGMALIGSDFYVANTDAILRFPYVKGQTKINAEPVVVTDLPGGPLNHHWTKNIIASRDGKKLYATAGSNSDVGENGMEKEEGRAAIWEVDLKSGTKRLFATGLRNPNGMGLEPQSGALWTVVNERDELGNDLVPDYLTSVTDGGFYGWPYSYFGQHVDQRAQPPRPDLVAKALKPDYSLGSHVAPLGMSFAKGSALPGLNSGVFVGQHGSWNREPRSGYNVVFVRFSGGKPVAEPPVEVLSGFVNATGEAQGRPVGVAIDKRGALLVADDVGNVVWRVSAAR